MRRSRRAEDDGREEEDDLPAGVHRTPAPWTLQAESWIFPHWTSTRRIADVRRESKVLLAQRQEEEDAAAGAASSSRDEQLAKAGLSPGSFHPLEKLHPLALALASSGAAEEAHSNEQQTQTEANNAKIRAAADEFRGGPGGWILYRYTHSPVGPYDELIYVAGLFKSPSAGNTALRITNIYVSSTASVYNGRKNWNIPKHRALFEWSQPAARTSSAAVQTVRVYLPVGGTQQQQQQQSKGKEIFAARLFPHLSSSCCNWLPSLPIPAFTAHIPSWLNLKLCAPPLLDCTTTTDSVGGGSGSGGSKSSSSSSSSKGEMQRDDEAQEEGLASSEPENVWRSVSPTFAGWARPARAEAILLGCSLPFLHHPNTQTRTHTHTHTHTHTPHAPSPARAFGTPPLSRGTKSDKEGKAAASYGDGVYFPKLEQSWGWGVHLDRVTVEFPLPQEFKHGQSVAKKRE